MFKNTKWIWPLKRSEVELKWAGEVGQVWVTLDPQIYDGEFKGEFDIKECLLIVTCREYWEEWSKKCEGLDTQRTCFPANWGGSQFAGDEKEQKMSKGCGWDFLWRTEGLIRTQNDGQINNFDYRQLQVQSTYELLNTWTLDESEFSTLSNRTLAQRQNPVYKVCRDFKRNKFK